jgi:tRNA pseudouridine55 synthase
VLLDPHAPVRLAAELQLTGAIAQIPPTFSAKHVDGQRAYDLARRGREVVLQPVPIVVHQWEWLGATPSSLTVRITCGGGTYIRALARDLGRLLGSAAHCGVLRRVASGAARVEDAVPLSALAPGSVAEGEVSLMSPRPLLEPIASEVLDDTQRHALRFGRRIPATQPGTRAALLVDGEVVAIAERTADEQWQPRVVLLDAES